MNRGYEIYESIDRYLQGELSEVELQQFNEKLQSDAEFKSLVEAQQLAHEVIVYNELTKLKERMSKDLKQQKSGFDHWGKVLSLSAIAISASLFTYSYLDRTETPSEKKEVVKEKKTPEVAIENKQEEQTQYPEPRKKQDIDKESNEITPIVNDSIIGEKEIKHEDITLEKNIPSPVNTTKEPALSNLSKEPVIATKVDCDVVHIHADVHVDYGFSGHEDGTIIIDPKSVKGGKEPYSYSLNNSEFQSDHRFAGLKDGKYQLRIKDQNNCISSLKKEVVVKVPAKEIDEVFMPSQGETWKFPIKENSNCEIVIISKAGSIVYSASIQQGNPSEWDGRNNNGVELESGNYYFVIKYASSDVVRGHISIVR